MQKTKIQRSRGKIIFGNAEFGSLSDEDIERIVKYAEFLVEKKQRQSLRHRMSEWWERFSKLFYTTNGKEEHHGLNLQT